MSEHKSIFKSGRHSTGQHFDFILEEENKVIAPWLPRGTPTLENRQTAVRNSMDLGKIKCKLLDILSLDTVKYIMAFLCMIYFLSFNI